MALLWVEPFFASAVALSIGYISRILLTWVSFEVFANSATSDTACTVYSILNTQYAQYAMSRVSHTSVVVSQLT